MADAIIERMIRDNKVIPFNGEAKSSFVKRYVGLVQNKDIPPYKVGVVVDNIWNEAKKRSQVSIKTSSEEFLLF